MALAGGDPIDDGALGLHGPLQSERSQVNVEAHWAGLWVKQVGVRILQQCGAGLLTGSDARSSSLTAFQPIQSGSAVRMSPEDKRAPGLILHQGYICGLQAPSLAQVRVCVGGKKLMSLSLSH